MRAYLMDDPEHQSLRQRLLEAAEPVVTSELAWLEFASAVAAAGRHRRLRHAQLMLDRFEADCSDDNGPLTLLRLDVQQVLPIAQRLVRDHRLRTLDAVHLAVALTDGVDLAAGDELTVVTRDGAQAAAARAHGLTTG